ncbi:unnamed protein product [Caenorhabditis auriculariae]|uniref:Uncharacterized protein n=1 Tax=Caenorhabditis auriculariae TaxID=2777116 RepID=A0A8S1GZ38_9PELO|nr:unnamed protein product [Caenorhabditis auriculariae]
MCTGVQPKPNPCMFSFAMSEAEDRGLPYPQALIASPPLSPHTQKSTSTFLLLLHHSFNLRRFVYTSAGRPAFGYFQSFESSGRTAAERRLL